MHYILDYSVIRAIWIIQDTKNVRAVVYYAHKPPDQVCFIRKCVCTVDTALLDRRLLLFSFSSDLQKPGWETCCDIAGTDTSACDRQI